MRTLLFAAAVLFVLLLVLFRADIGDYADDATQVKTTDTSWVGEWQWVEIPTTTTTTTTVQPRARSAPTIRAASASAPSAVVSDETWDRIAACESGGRWDLNSGNGYSGGLQFAASTWIRAGGRRFAAYAYQATREQQIQIANEWLARTSWSQWPECSRRVGVR